MWFYGPLPKTPDYDILLRMKFWSNRRDITWQDARCNVLAIYFHDHQTDVITYFIGHGVEVQWSFPCAWFDSQSSRSIWYLSLISLIPHHISVRALCQASNMNKLCLIFDLRCRDCNSSLKSEWIRRKKLNRIKCWYCKIDNIKNWHSFIFLSATRTILVCITCLRNEHDREPYSFQQYIIIMYRNIVSNHTKNGFRVTKSGKMTLV